MSGIRKHRPEAGPFCPCQGHAAGNPSRIQAEVGPDGPKTLGEREVKLKTFSLRFISIGNPDENIISFPLVSISDR